MLQQLKLVASFSHTRLHPGSLPALGCRFRNWLYSAWAHDRAYKIHVSRWAGLQSLLLELRTDAGAACS